MFMAFNRSRSLEIETVPQRRVDPDSILIEQLEKAILKNAGGLAKFKKEIPLLLRKAIDEVIDSARTNRSTLDETRINERIYLGTKVRVQLRNRLKLAKGRMLDLCFGETEVGIQSTIRQTWSVSREFIGHPCFLVKSDEKHLACSVGLLVIRNEVLKAAGNSTGRRMISDAGIANIRWMLKDEPLPATSS
jgi:hypothetical protein